MVSDQRLNCFGDIFQMSNWIYTDQRMFVDEITPTNNVECEKSLSNVRVCPSVKISAISPNVTHGQSVVVKPEIQGYG